MMKLTTKHIGDIDGCPAIAWRVGTQRKGVICVQGLHNTPDSLAAAELVSIRHLIFTNKVFNRDIVSGAGIELAFSSAVIKKVFRGKTSKKHLDPFAHFYKTTLDGAILSLSDQNDEFLPKIEDDVLVEYVEASESSRYDIISTPTIGEVRLTKHSVDQYAERLHSGDAKNPRTSLIGRLNHHDLKRQQIPDRTARHKLRKYGTIDNLEIWGHDSSQLNFVIVRAQASKIGTLVTVYRRHPAFNEI